MRRVALALAALMPALAAPAAAQVDFFMGTRSSDSALGALSEVEFELPVRVTLNGYCVPSSFCYYYAQSGRLTFVYDPAKLEVIQFVAEGWSVLDTIRGTGTFTVSASGFPTLEYEPRLFRLRVKLLAAAPDGTFLWVRPDSAALQYYFSSTPFQVDGTSSVAQMCYATEQYGDLDGNGRVESRDALITLTGAVGLPVGGFNLALGDVDGDNLTSSRDALMMLSYAVSLPIYVANRIAQGVPSACPPLGAAPEAIVFRRSAGSGSDTLYLLPATSSTPAAVPNAAGTLSHPRLAADGISVAYQCNDASSYPQVCRINTDGSAFAQLTSGFNYSETPDWSPDGAKLSFRFNGYPYTMDNTGAGQVQTGANFMSYVATLAWNRDGTVLAYPSSGVRFVNSDGTNDVPVTTGFTDAVMIRWSPAGDSLAFTRPTGRAYLVPSAGGTGSLAFAFSTLAYRAFDWGPPGFVFGLTQPGREGLYYLASPTAPLVRLTRGKDTDPAFRRNP